MALQGTNRRITRAVLLLASLATGPAALAQDRYALGAGFLGGAALETSVVHQDNYFYESSDGISTTGYSLRPSVDASRAGSWGTLNANASLEHADFDIPGDLDHYTDFDFGGDIGWQALSRHRFDLAGSFRRGHDASGLRRTEGSPDFSSGKLDRWNSSNAALTYRYGSAESLGSSTIRYGGNDRHYLTNRRATAFLDFTTRFLDYVLAYEYSPRTAVLFYVGKISTDYERPVLGTLGNRNGNELNVRTGLRWTATGKTSGEVQAGLREYSFDGRGRESRQSLSFRANVNWEPRPITVIQLNAGQATTQTFRADTFFIEETSVGLDWRQRWSSRFSTRAGVSYAHSKFVGADREDDYFSPDASFDYRLARQLGLFGSYVLRSRESNFALRDYDAPEARLGLRFTL